MKQWLSVLALSVAVAARGGAQTPVAAPQKSGFEPKPVSIERTLIDRDALRSIEVVTDRHESIAQFFGRQKLVLALPPALDDQFLHNKTSTKNIGPRSIFVSYPLANDAKFRMDLFGAYYQLLPPVAAVVSLWTDKARVPSSWTQTMLILAPARPAKTGEKPTAR